MTETRKEGRKWWKREKTTTDRAIKGEGTGKYRKETGKQQILPS